VQVNKIHAKIVVCGFSDSSFADRLIHPTLKIEDGLILIEGEILVLTDTVE
jgi:hypothetical protein